jgi:hypothetical protein
MTKKEKAVDQYIRDKHSTDECYAYIEGWEDAHDYQINKLYWVLALGMLLGGVIMELITLIIK